MRRTTLVRAASAALALSLVTASCAGRDDDKSSSGDKTTTSAGQASTDTLIDTADCPDTGTAGISGDTITLASSFPQSGLTAAFSQISKGYKAYFDKVNADGGVEVAGKKYQIKVVDKDDEYNAAKTAQNITELAGTNGDKAFAVFNVVGTANNVAIRDDLGEQCVPNVFAATGAPTWGNPDYPWTIGSTLAPYTLEAKALADFIIKEKPQAKVAMLLQDDDYGQAYEEGFTKAFEGTDVTIVQTAKYAPGAGDVTSQITSLAASKADVFFNGATLLACPNGLTKAAAANWKPMLLVSGTCISKTLMGLAGPDADGAYAASNIMDPTDPANDDEAAMKEYRSVVEKFGASDIDPDNGIVAYGYTQGVVLVKALEGLKKLDRASLMEAMHNLDLGQIGLLVNGANVKTGPDDPFLVENLQIVKYDATAAHFNNVGEILDFEGKTKEFTPEDLITN